MAGIWTGVWNEISHAKSKKAKKDKKNEDREAELAALEDAQNKEQPMTNKLRSIYTSSELPDANILQRMREILIESDISGDIYIRASGFA